MLTTGMRCRPSLETFFKIISQGSYRLEKYLNVQGCLEKSLKIRFALKSTGKTLIGLEKSLNFTIYRRIQHCLWRSKLLCIQEFSEQCFFAFISLCAD